MKKQNQSNSIAIMGFSLFCAIKNVLMQDLTPLFCDQALATNPSLAAWNLTDSLLTSHLAGSDTEALGGDLAYQYNLNGSLAGMGIASAQTVINDTNFGVSTQQLHPLEDLQTGTVRLS